MKNMITIVETALAEIESLDAERAKEGREPYSRTATASIISYRIEEELRIQVALRAWSLLFPPEE